ncbi:MAG TPA: 30S ribosomal protein THX [Anseongella sp.]
MGKGDKKTKRGKIIIGTHGVSRPKKRVQAAPVTKAETTAKKASGKKAPAKKEKTSK